MGDFRRRVPHQTDHPVGPSVGAAQDPCLDMGPLVTVVFERHPEMDAVGGAPALDGLVDRHIEADAFRRIEPLHQGLGP